MTNTATTPSGQPLGISHKPSATEAMFDRLKAENKPAFIGYLPYGFPNPDISLDALRTMIEHGVDAVEIGLPYSDPVMDGPVIQAASQIALNNGESINGVFKAVETVANAGGVPLIMSYWNLIYHYGVERFACDFENAGGAGLITPDLIPDEAGRVDRGFGSSRTRPHLPGLPGFGLRTSRTGRPQRTRLRLRGIPYGRHRRARHYQRIARNACRACPQRRGEKRVRGYRRIHPGAGREGSGAYADGVIVGSALVHTLLDDDNVTAKAPKEGLRDLAAKVEALSEGIHNESR